LQVAQRRVVRATIYWWRQDLYSEPIDNTKGFTMSSKLLPTLATVVIAVAGAVAMTGALAVEATQYNPEPGTATRAQVQSELRGATTASGVVQLGEATVFVDRPSALTRAQARDNAVEGTSHVVRLGEATEFVDVPSVRTRAEVRAETLAAIRAARAH